MINDIRTFAALLGGLYNREDLGRSPESNTNIARAAEDLTDLLASPLRCRSSGQGFGLTLAERRAVEKHAMNVAQKSLVESGHKVEDVSRNRPFDFLATRSGVRTIVEVKGTTGGLGSIILTANEVLAHEKNYPNNALIIIHSIELDRQSTNPQASGGVVHILSPWELDRSALRPLSYQYII